MTTVKSVIAFLQTLEPDEHIMIQWYTREHTEQNMGDSISEEVWNEAVHLTDKWGIDFNETVWEAVNVAQAEETKKK